MNKVTAFTDHKSKSGDIKSRAIFRLTAGMEPQYVANIRSAHKARRAESKAPPTHKRAGVPVFVITAASWQGTICSDYPYSVPCVSTKTSDIPANSVVEKK